MRPRSMSAELLLLGQVPVARQAPRSVFRGLLDTLNQVAECGSLAAATQAVQAPAALASPLPARTRRHMRTARVSWW